MRTASRSIRKEEREDATRREITDCCCCCSTLATGNGVPSAVSHRGTCSRFAPRVVLQCLPLLLELSCHPFCLFPFLSHVFLSDLSLCSHREQWVNKHKATPHSTNSNLPPKSNKKQKHHFLDEETSHNHPSQTEYFDKKWSPRLQEGYSLQSMRKHSPLKYTKISIKIHTHTQIRKTT